MHIRKFFEERTVKYILFAVILIVGYIFFSRFEDSGINGGLEKLREHILSFGVRAPLAYMFFFILRPLLMFPAGVFMAMGGFIFGGPCGFFYSLLAAQISAVVEFLLARYFIRSTVRSRMGDKMRRFDDAVAENGFKAVFLIRLIPNLLYDIQNCSFGVTSVRFGDYFFGTLLGNIPLFLAFIYLGVGAGVLIA